MPPRCTCTEKAGTSTSTTQVLGTKKGETASIPYGASFRLLGGFVLLDGPVEDLFGDFSHTPRQLVIVVAAAPAPMTSNINSAPSRESGWVEKRNAGLINPRVLVESTGPGAITFEVAEQGCRVASQIAKVDSFSPLLQRR